VKGLEINCHAKSASLLKVASEDGLSGVKQVLLSLLMDFKKMIV